MDLSLRVKPASNVEISAGPGYAYDESRTGFVDRFSDATFAYQGAGRGFDPHVLHQLESWVQGARQRAGGDLVHVGRVVDESQIVPRGRRRFVEVLRSIAACRRLGPHPSVLLSQRGHRFQKIGRKGEVRYGYAAAITRSRPARFAS